MSGVGLVAPFSDVMQLLDVLALFSRGNLDINFCELLFWQTLALVFKRQSTDAFGRISCLFYVKMNSDPQVVVFAPFARENLVFSTSPLYLASLALDASVLEAFGRSPRIFCVKVNSDLEVEVACHFAAFFGLRRFGR